ncbi:hypothetical protein [Nonomuraea turkmeniaca]|uniref:hypothetical protein n=1 Tax=Nonomuraea turkmeniaca TaxID=103838 RepID=UPI001B866564|nr:hypothetical protein [Nonomuraea turkmeniaca]
MGMPGAEPVSGAGGIVVLLSSPDALEAVVDGGGVGEVRQGTRANVDPDVGDVTVVVDPVAIAFQLAPSPVINGLGGAQEVILQETFDDA